MKKTIKTFALLGSGLLLVSFTVVVVNQTAQVVQLAKTVHPVLGSLTLWGLVLAYGGMVGVPAVILLRMPRPLVPPTNEAGPEFEEHLKLLGKRLAGNPRVAQAALAGSLSVAVRVLERACVPAPATADRF